MRNILILTLAMLPGLFSTAQKTTPASVAKTIFIYCGSPNKVFIKYIAGLIRKQNPRICFIPTA